MSSQSAKISDLVGSMTSVMDQISAGDTTLAPYLEAINRVYAVGVNTYQLKTKVLSPGFADVFSDGLYESADNDPASSMPDFPDFIQIGRDTQDTLDSVDTASIQKTIKDGMGFF
jgi:hypothetical protein